MGNGSNINEEHLELLNILGEEKIKEAFKIVGGKKFTIKPLVDHLKRLSIKKALETTNKTHQEIATENDVCTRTVQKIRREQLTKKHKPIKLKFNHKFL